MRIKLFGNLRISCAGRPVTSVNTNRLHSLVAYLVLHGDAPQPRERLAFVLWPASSESQARTNLRQLVHHLRRALPAECDSLATDHFSVRWRQDVPCAIDVVEFQAAIAEAALARTEQDHAREVQSLTTAAQLYEDDLLPAQQNYLPYPQFGSIHNYGNFGHSTSRNTWSGECHSQN